MGLTKEYLRYVQAGNFNIVASPNCNVVFVVVNGQEGRYVAVGACEHVFIFDLRLGEKAQVLLGEKSPATFLCASPNQRNLAVGYADGNIQIFDLRSAEVVCTFSGHKSEITSLAYDSFGHKLASGSKDTDVIIWDTVAETGLCRLSGHKGPVTQIAFMANRPVLISGAKDSFVKFWDLDNQHCFKTLVGHQSEVWSLTLAKDGKYLITGSGLEELKVWKLTDKSEDEAKPTINELTFNLDATGLEDHDDPSYSLQCHKPCSLLRIGRGRVTNLISDLSGQIVACKGKDAKIEFFYFCSDDEAQTRFKKRVKKLRKKRSKEVGEAMEVVDDNSEDSLQLSTCDEIRRLSVIELKQDIKSFDMIRGNDGELRVVITFSNNTMSLYRMVIDDKTAEPQALRSIMNNGHHSEVRTLSFSSDNLAIVSGSAESIKMWNRQTMSCIRTVQTGYVMTAVFAPGDRHILAGLKDGKLLIIDIGAGDILEEIPAHEGELRSLCLQPNLRGCISGGEDATVKFWQFELVLNEDSGSKAKVLSLLHKRTLKLEQPVLCVKLSQNGKFVAVSLLDSTVKLFFVDTFTFCRSLFGHTLPVLCMDISSDSSLIATGSGDRTVKIWGMDYGDIHSRIFAHDSAVTGLQFVTGTHYFFTCSRDGKVKEWDGNSFNKIITLQGHVGAAWNLALSPNGQFVVSAGSDRVLRMYEKSDQVLVLQDEEEDEREQEELATGEKTIIPGQSALNLPSKKTVGSEKGAESILECLEICEEYSDQLKEHAASLRSTQSSPPPVLHPLMQMFKVSNEHDFLLETIRRIRANDLEESLILLPFSSVCEILKLLPPLLDRGDQTELVCKLAIFLVKIHHAPIVANQALLSILKKVFKKAVVKTEELRDMIAYNKYGLQFMQNMIEESEGVQLFRDASINAKQRNKNRRIRENRKRALVTLS